MNKYNFPKFMGLVLTHRKFKHTSMADPKFEFKIYKIYHE